MIPGIGRSVILRIPGAVSFAGSQRVGRDRATFSSLWTQPRVRLFVCAVLYSRLLGLRRCVGALSSCRPRASPAGLSPVAERGSGACSPQQLRRTGPAALRHVGASQTRDRTRGPRPQSDAVLLSEWEVVLRPPLRRTRL